MDNKADFISITILQIIHSLGIASNYNHIYSKNTEISNEVLNG